MARSTVLAGWARAAGYDVQFASGPAYANVARSAGLNPIPLPTIAPAQFYQRLTQGQFFYTAEELHSYVRAELTLIEDVQPDLVVSEFRLSLGISAALAGTPLLSLANAYWSPAAASRFPPPRSSFLGRLPRPLGTALFACLRPLAFRRFGCELNRVRRSHGLEAVSDFRAHYTAGRWCAYLDPPDWVPLGRLPAGHFWLGPVAWQPPTPAALELDRFGQERPLAYVSLGSSGAGAVLSQVVQALVALDCDIVCSGVGTESAQRQSTRAGRFLAAPLLDPEPVLRRAALTVCHGGSGTIYQSLAAGIPVLCLPSNPDQSLAAAAAVAHGAGLALDSVRQGAVQTALQALLRDGSYKKAADRIAQRLRQYDTKARWLDWLASVSANVGSARHPVHGPTADARPLLPITSGGG